MKLVKIYSLQIPISPCTILKRKKVVFMRVAIYLRVSTEQQKEGDSLREQEASLLDHAKTNGWEVIDIYRDEGISGRKDKRDEFQRLMSDVEAGKIDIIIFTYLVRWFRNTRHYLNTQAILDKHKVEWKAIHEPNYDTTTAMGRAFVTIAMAIGELEPEATSERIRTVFDHKIALGEVVSGTVPLGYSIQKKETGKGKVLVINDDAAMVKDIFNHYIEFGSMNRAVKHLYNQYGIERDYQSVKNMLTNKKYIGEHRGNKNYCPAIIDHETFETAQKMLSKNIKSNTKRTFIFSGLVKCGICGAPYSGTTRIIRYNRKKEKTKVAKEHKLHRCNNHRRQRHRCDNKKIYNEKYIEEFLLENIQLELKKHTVRQKSKQSKKTDDKAKIQKINTKLERLKAAYLNELIEIDEYKKDREDLLDELATLEKKPKILTMQALNTVLDKQFNNVYNNASEEEKRAIWRSIIDKLIVDDEGNIKIIFLS